MNIEVYVQQNKSIIYYNIVIPTSKYRYKSLYMMCIYIIYLETQIQGSLKVLFALYNYLHLYNKIILKGLLSFLLYKYIS